MASNGGTMVPFKGSLDGQSGTATGAFPLINESIMATGRATHLGRYTLNIAETVNLVEATATGTFTFTAANGDTIYGSFTGRAQPGPLVAIVEEARVRGEPVGSSAPGGTSRSIACSIPSTGRPRARSTAQYLRRAQPPIEVRIWISFQANRASLKAKTRRGTAEVLTMRRMERWYRYGDSNPGFMAENHLS